MPDLSLPPGKPQVVSLSVPGDPRGAMVLFGLLAESLVVALLAWPERWFSRTVRWMLITTGTWIGLILIPFGWWNIHIQSVADAFGCRVLLLESAIVVLEGLILWWLLQQHRNQARQRQEWAAGASFLDSLGISLAGNGMSFLISVIWLGLPS